MTHRPVLHVAAIFLAGLIVVPTLTGCAPTQNTATSQEQQVLSEACSIIVSELKATGLSLAELVPENPMEADPNVLANAYAVAASTLDRARGHVEDVSVGEIIDTATGAMERLVPVFEQAANGDATALLGAGGPISELTGVAASCGTAAFS